MTRKTLPDNRYPKPAPILEKPAFRPAVQANHGNWFPGGVNRG
jgi:hypothetical protein